jgi:hypothetical protein
MKNELKLSSRKSFPFLSVPSQKRNTFMEWLGNKNRKIQFSVLLICILSGIAGSLFFSYFLIYRTMPILWHWGFATGWQEVLSAVVTLYLILGGLLPLVLLSDTIHNILSLTTRESKKDSDHDAKKDLSDRISEILKQPHFENNQEQVIH